MENKLTTRLPDYTQAPEMSFPKKGGSSLI